MHFQTQLERDVEVDDQTQVQLWTERVRNAFDELEMLVDAQRRRIHSKLFSEIGNQDECQRKHIRTLQDADTQVANLLEVVKSQLIVLCMQSSSEVEARVENQGADDETVQDIIDRGTELIHWIRDQEDAVTSWFAEAFINAV